MKPSTFHPGALDLAEESTLMQELSPQQLSSSEHSSSPDLCLRPRIQTGLDLLQPPAPVKLQDLFVHRADQLLQEDQRPAQSLRLLLTACRKSPLIRVREQMSSKDAEAPMSQVTFGVVQDPLNENGVLCDPLRHQ